MNFPVLLKTSPEVGCEENVHYLVASNGVFKIVETDTYRAVTLNRGAIEGLLPERQSLQLRFPPVPKSLLQEALAFFREVFVKYGGEAMVVLFYRPETRTYRLVVPHQTIPGYVRWDGSWRAYLHLRYEQPPRPDGHLRFGTIHSHADVGAEASSTDCEDEQFNDGLHVVYGNIDRFTPSLSACFVAQGVRFAIDPYDVLEPCSVPDVRA
jgi:hypothetical protein